MKHGFVFRFVKTTIENLIEIWYNAFHQDKGKEMIICYKKLWKLLIDKGINKVELQHLTGVSSATITKLAKNKTVNTGVLIRICTVLRCDTSDIMEMADEKTCRSMVTRL